MPEIFQYLLKVSVSLAVVYIFYQLVLQRLTFYNSNRWYLLGYTILSFVIPFINISKVVDENYLVDNDIVQFIPVIENYTVPLTALPEASDSLQFGNWDGVFLMLIIGVLVMLVRFFLQYFSYRKMRRNARLLLVGDVRVYQVDRPIIPFSFGKSIFINQQLHNEEELEKIIRHEFVHVKQKHTIDIIWSEVLCILNWYNPFAWLLRTDMRQNLEFIADKNVVETGIDKKKYQYLLLKVIGVPQFSLASQFNFSSLKKRIAMMNKMKSAKVHLVKFLFVLPLMAVLLLAFRDRNIKIGQAIIKKEQIPPSLKNDHAVSNGVLIDNASDTIPSAPANSKGYFIAIKDNNGQSTVVVENKNRKVIEIVDLLKWKANQKHYKMLYGEILPPPPPPPRVVQGPSEPSTVIANAQNVINASQSVMAITSQAIANGQNEINALQSVIATTSQSNVVSTVATPQRGNVGETTVIEKILELRIYKTTTKAKLDHLIDEAKTKGVVLAFAAIEYNEKGQLVAISGTVKKENTVQNFNANGFEIVILVMYTKDSHTYFHVTVSDKKEVS